jgi:hypothetical protein
MAGNATVAESKPFLSSSRSFESRSRSAEFVREGQSDSDACNKGEPPVQRDGTDGDENEAIQNRPKQGTKWTSAPSKKIVSQEQAPEQIQTHADQREQRDHMMIYVLKLHQMT